MAPRPFVLRLRRGLTGVVPDPDWPAGIQIRTLVKKKEDAKAAHAVLEAGYWEGGGGAPMFHKWWSQLKKNKEFDPDLVFLATDIDGVVGIAQCWTSGFIKDLAVHPRARRRGVARALMLTALQAFKERRHKHVDLKVREENSAALALYQQLGMQVVGREPG